MDFSWTPEQLALRERLIQDSHATELNRGLEERDQHEAFLAAHWKACARLGILGWNVPVEYGGRGRDILTAVLLLEALGYGCRDNGLTLAVNAQIWTIQEPLLTFGSEEQKRAYLPKLCAGELLAADAVTEEGAGSDALSMTTVARKTADGYVLNGRKTFIGMAPVADVALVFAKTDPSAGQWGISAFLVDKGTPGFTATSNVSKSGLRTIPMGGFELTDCVVPESSRLGAEGVGLSMFNHTLEWERSFILASHVGAMARQLDETVAHAKAREQFGRPIGELPVGVQPDRGYESAARDRASAALQAGVDEAPVPAGRSRGGRHQTLSFGMLRELEPRCRADARRPWLSERARHRARSPRCRRRRDLRRHVRHPAQPHRASPRALGMRNAQCPMPSANC